MGRFSSLLMDSGQGSPNESRKEQPLQSKISSVNKPNFREETVLMNSLADIPSEYHCHRKFYRCVWGEVSCKYCGSQAIKVAEEL